MFGAYSIMKLPYYLDHSKAADAADDGLPAEAPDAADGVGAALAEPTAAAAAARRPARAGIKKREIKKAFIS